MSQFFKNGDGGSGGGGITTITGDSGSITGSNVTIYSNRIFRNAGSSVGFDNSGSISIFNLTDSKENTFLGKLSGNNAVLGGNNTSVGYMSMNQANNGGSNCAYGTSSLASLTTGSQNIAIGPYSGRSLTEGSDNTLIGMEAGSNYLDNENNNICIGSIVNGVSGESYVTRIGNQYAQKCFITGFANVSVPNSKIATVDLNSQLGSIPKNSFLNNIISSNIDFKTSSDSTIFTATEGDFLITNIIFLGIDITGTITGATCSFGWTAPNYDDFQTGAGTSNNTNGQFSQDTNPGSIVVPIGSDFRINITGPDPTATTNVQKVIIQGFYI